VDVSRRILNSSRIISRDFRCCPGCWRLRCSSRRRSGTWHRFRVGRGSIIF